MIKKFYKNRRVLVTGATGFKGSWLCAWLNDLGAEVCGTGYSPNYNKNLFKQLKLDKKIKVKIFDIRDLKKTENCIREFKPEIIIHMAAQPLIIESYKKPHETIEINFKGTMNILEVVRKISFVKALICITSDKCYENKNTTRGYKENDIMGGIDPYSVSKASSELLVRAYRESFFKNKNCGVATARAGNVIGGGDWSANRLVPDCVKFLLKKKTIYIRNPHFNRPWQYVLEPLKGYLQLGYYLTKNPKKFEGAWNFGTKPNSITSVEKIVKLIIFYWKYGKYKTNKKNKYYEQFNLQLNSNKSKNKLNWKITYNVRNAIRVTIEWYKCVFLKKENAYDVTIKQIRDYMNANKWS